MSELKKAIDQISKDRGIDRDLLIDTLEEAVRSAVHRKYGDTMDIEVTFNEELGEIEVYQFKVVVEDVHDEISEITLEEAKEHDPNVQLDDEMGFKLAIEDLGRIAAQSAKQVIIQRMRDAEQEIIYEEFKDRTSEIVSGIIQRRDRTGWIINLGRTEALLPKDEQIPRERYKRGDRVQAYIIDVLKESRGPQVIVSRSHPDYMAELFKREVPEVADGTVKIMGVARDPGLRAKVAVSSRDRDVDPVGACVGIRGSRIQNVVQELKGERIDIVVWSPDIARYAQHALSPAVITRIMVDDEEETLEVVVPDDQLTLAIGRKGQNVKLAARLLGWKVDIFTETRHAEMNAALKGMDQIASVAEVSIDSFIRAGFDSTEAVATASDEALLAVEGLDEERIGEIRVAMNMLGLTAPAAFETDEAEETVVEEPADAEENEQEAEEPKE
ncbi:transcription termination factor NusA [Pseudodesulfovibrio senegalensis]|jgi:N utilization substance protein A|uniref:Transcription termination/antitermination protein NusA n=1 Tax=Pseudodesulfovibrio senegalensis TaxID=1721087 RepID=A0A6N6N117_9BACT|nr:transcription termination factor NusA [Pseudodesulfovibrio senegalensis]KAB1440243.1 transcription termination/antitermination protein NusA [Pseudodesulfovibrio senegalensis]